MVNLLIWDTRLDHFKVTYKPFGKKAILMEWPSRVDVAILDDIIAFKQKLYGRFYKVEIVSAYNSLTIIFPSLIDFELMTKTLKNLYRSSAESLKKEKRLWKIPICYDVGFGIDLEAFSKEKNLTIEEIMEIHTSAKYTVFCIGFLPGFLYLGGLNEKLHLHRRNEPRLNIPKGSVGIGGEQTGIYPQESPGGWNIIGNSPVKIFDASKSNPCPINVGDKVRFHSISKPEHDLISIQVEAGIFKLKSELIHD